MAKDTTESTDYGSSPADLDVASDEIGDVLFSLLALAEALDIDAGDALDEALAKYESELLTPETPRPVTEPSVASTSRWFCDDRGTAA